MEYTVSYSAQYTLLRHEGDLYGRMRPATLLRYAQQIATDQSARTGIDDAWYREHHCAYLLAKQAFRFARIPCVDEVLTYTTLPEQSRRACNKRITLVTDEAGQEVACVDSRWMLVDTDTRRIIRRPGPELDGRWNPEVSRELEQRVPRAAVLQEGGACRAGYSLCDKNGHLNNAAYLDVACDFLPPELLRQGVARMAISYHRELPFGTAFSVRYGEAEGGVYLCGVREGEGAGDAPAFEVWCGA